MGVLWFVTDEGISQLTPAPEPAPVPRPAMVTALRIRGVLRPIIFELGETQLQHIKLAPDENQLQIEFVGLDFRPGAFLRYQYKLESGDRDWSPPTSERSVNYASLAPGSYRFLLRAVTSEGIGSPNPAVVGFTILPPLWRRWWFIGLEVFVMGCLIYAIYCYRVRQLLALERIRTRIAADLHDDIGSGLSQIAILSEVVARLERSDARQTELVLKIAEISRTLADSMSDVVWAINPARDRLGDLVRRMRQFVGDLFIARDIEVQFAAPPVDHDLHLDPETRRQLFLIFKECVHNMARHSRCSKVAFQLGIEGKRLVLTATDNGVGFDVTLATPGQAQGHGLANIRLRAARLGGSVNFRSAERQGTTVTVSVPVRR
jgi:two-component sensor histidine kinase